MSDLKSIVAIRVNEQDLSLYDLFYALKINGKLELLTDAAEEALISQAVEREGIAVSDEELQQAADGFRRDEGLQKTGDMEQWLKEHYMTVEDLEARLEQSVATHKLKDKIATEEAVERYFAENRLSFDAARISHIVVEREGVAAELFAQITEEEADFYALARRYSTDRASKGGGGYLGGVNRKELSPAEEAVVFSAREGEVIGPVKTGQGYCVIKVEEFQYGELNDQTREAIKTRLFRNWLEKQSHNASINVKLMEWI